MFGSGEMLMLRLLQVIRILASMYL